MSFAINITPVVHWLGGCPNDIACMKKLDDEIVFDAVNPYWRIAKNEKVKSRWRWVDWKSASY